MLMMPWNASLSVSYEPDDMQHERLTELINLLHDAMTLGRAHQVLGYVLDELVAFIRSSFVAEERLMDAYDYPLHELHSRRHRVLTQEVVSLRGRFAAGKPIRIADVLLFLQSWLVGHIQRSDRVLGRFLAATA
jgi:hemerythrin-like metal-binding protein